MECSFIAIFPFVTVLNIEMTSFGETINGLISKILLNFDHVKESIYPGLIFFLDNGFALCF